MTIIQRKHLKNRLIKPFNVASKKQENIAKMVANHVWDRLLVKYPNYTFNNLKSLGLTRGLDAEFSITYMNRGYARGNLTSLELNKLQAYETADGIKPDGGVFFVQAKDGFNHIIAALEVKHQGEYDGYTSISDAEWKKRKHRGIGPLNLPYSQRPPQAQGNAIERFAKNANAIKTLTSFYGYNPYVILCEGFDFYLKDEFHIFANKPCASRFKNRDSSILMRLIAGNDWRPLNKIYVECIDHGKTKICPATIMARMEKWTVEECEKIMFKVIDKALNHLKEISEI